MPGFPDYIKAKLLNNGIIHPRANRQPEFDIKYNPDIEKIIDSNARAAMREFRFVAKNQEEFNDRIKKAIEFETEIKKRQDELSKNPDRKYLNDEIEWYQRQLDNLIWICQDLN